MSICRGIAGRRGKNPVGIFIHNGGRRSECYDSVLQELLTKRKLGKRICPLLCVQRWNLTGGR